MVNFVNKFNHKNEKVKLNLFLIAYQKHFRYFSACLFNTTKGTFMFDSPELSWFVLGLVLILSEFIVPGFVIIFFGLGAWITALCTLIGLSPTISIQLAIFLASTVLTLVLFRKKGQRYFMGELQASFQRINQLMTFAVNARL